MRATTAAVLSCLLCGCASPQDSYEREFADKLKADGDAYLADYDRRLKTWKPQLAKYYGCNGSAARMVASQSGDPISLALAARNLCRADETDLRTAVYAAYSDNPKFGMESMEKVRKAALENNAGEIVAYRAKVIDRVQILIALARFKVPHLEVSGQRPSLVAFDEARLQLAEGAANLRRRERGKQAPNKAEESPGQ